MIIDHKLILENSKNLNILYVEDDKRLQIVTTKLFSTFFNSVDTAISAKDECFEQAIIFISAFNENRYLRQAIELGASGFLTKPVNIEELKKVQIKDISKDVNIVKEEKNSELPALENINYVEYLLESDLYF
ncbi:MAG: hypothetical protein U9P38_06945 [Campylobacterota bacterium]|nr:hypothetical protein [Campylobacterota bacterium]